MHRIDCIDVTTIMNQAPECTKRETTDTRNVRVTCAEVSIVTEMVKTRIAYSLYTVLV